MANILTIPESGIFFDGNTAGTGIAPILTGDASGVAIQYDGYAGVEINSSATGVNYLDRFSVEGANGRLFGVTDEVTGTVFSVNDAAGLPIIEVESTADHDKITIGEYGTNALVVSGDKVGIGTTTPSTKLHLDFTDNDTALADANGIRIENQSLASGAMAVAHFRVDSNDWYLGNRKVGSTSDFFITHEASELLTIDNLGNVGIGITSPDSKLHVASGDVLISNNQFYAAESTLGTNYKLAGLTSGNVIQVGAIDYTSASTVFAGGNNVSVTTGGAAGTSRLYINSSGNVGIGTTSPNDYKLEVSGGVEASSLSVSGSLSRVFAPDGATYNGGSSSTGYLIVKLPDIASAGINNMMTGVIRVFDYANNESFDVHFSGYWYGSGFSWTRCGAWIDSEAQTDRNFSVRFGRMTGGSGSADRAYVMIGEPTSTWAYCKFSVINFNPGHSNAQAHKWNSGWSMDISATNPGTVIRTVANTQSNNWKRNGQDVYYAGGTGNVGIGTTSPDEKLHVAGLEDGTPVKIEAAALNTVNGGAYSNYQELKFVADSSDNIPAGIRHLGNTWLRSDSALSFWTSQHGGSYAERMRIDGDGNVGIGTTDPFSKLTVRKAGINEGTISFDDQASNAHLTLAGSDALVRLQMGTYNNGSYGVWIQGSYDNGGTNYGTEPIILNPQGGKVGIGTTSPEDSLDIVGNLRICSSKTANTNKTNRIRGEHYNVAEEPTTLMFMNSFSATNQLYIGGGSSIENAATSLTFFTAANNTTTAGTLALTIDSSQNATFASGVTLTDGILTVNDGNNYVKISEGSNSIGQIELKDGNPVFLQGWGSEFKIAIGTYNNHALSIATNKNATFAGTVTATHFYGDGSNLTNLPSGSDNTKLPLAGGTVTGDLTVNGKTILGNALTDKAIVHGHLGIGHDDYPKIAYPGQNALWSGSGSTTGQIVIDLPGTLANFDMTYMEIDIYEYSNKGATKLIIGGHNWNSGANGNTSTTQWHNVNVQVLGALDKPIYFGRRNDGSNERRCIAIGETNSTWSYATVQVHKVHGAEFYASQIDWVGDWNIDQTTSGTYFTKNPTTNFNSGTTLETNGNISATSFVGDNAIVNKITAATSSGDIKFRDNNGSTKVTIKDSGEVGIGTTSPADKLEVEDGNIRIETTSNTDAKLILNPYSDALNATYQWELVGKNSANSYNFQIRENGTPYLTIENSVNGNTGNVGIGTTSPSAPLEIAGAASATDTGITIKNGSATRLRLFHNDNAGASYLTSYDGVGAAQALNIRSGNKLYLSGGGGATHMTINTSGEVGIGNTNPTAAKLIVRQDSGYAFRTENASGWTFRVAGDTGDTEVGGDLTVSGDLTVNGTTATINSTTLQVDDKNIELGTVATPTDTTADGGGITLKGATDKTINWVNSTSSWTSNQTFSTPNLTLTNLSTYSGSQFTALMIDGNTVGKRALGSNAFNSTSYLPLAGGNMTGHILLNTGIELRSKDTSSNIKTIARVNSTNELEYGWSAGGPVKFMGGGSYTERMRIHTNGNVGIGTTTPSYKLDVATSGGVRAGGKTTYTKTFSTGLNTSGELVAEITTGYNGASALFEFTCFGGNAGCYQKVVWSLYNASGTWYASNPINEGTNHYDVTYSSGEFTFKTRSGTQAYQPRVIVEAAGDSIDNSYA